MSKLANLLIACKISDDIFSKLIENISDLRTEKDIEKFILSEISNKGLAPSFQPVIGTGKNASNPHNKPSNNLLNGFTFIDFGVTYKGYCSDITRTFYFGEPSKKEIDLYNFLYSIQKKALKFIDVGGKYCELDLKTRKEMGFFKKFFIHPLGHGIGKKVHLYPKITSIYDSKLSIDNLRRLKTAKIKEGDSFTIEPGIYKKNLFGIRIEDTVIIKDKKVLILTNFSKKLLIFKKTLVS